ncbi:MAG: hypothetical protein AAB221_01570 [Bacteroidota bacterium]
MAKILRELTIIGGLFLVFIIGYAILNPGKRRMLGRARKLHMQGETYYERGDVELADEYYNEADKLRKAAREVA